MALAAAARRWTAIERTLEEFQRLGARFRHAEKPVVVAVGGRALGGGCELAMASAHPVAAAESYLGLVEIGVGLVPAGGGAARMTALAADRAASTSPAAVFPHLRRAFETVARATVSRSAEDAQDLGFLPRGAPVVMHADRLLHVAREEVARLAAQGVAPEPRRARVRVLGAPARAAFEVGLRHMRQGGFIAAHDERVAARLAWVMTGGDVAAPADVPMSHLFELERQAFLVLGEPDTQVRIAELLTKGRPRLVRLAAKGLAGLAHVLGPRGLRARRRSHDEVRRVDRGLRADRRRQGAAGARSGRRPDDLAGRAIRGALARVAGVEPEDVDDVILGCAMPEAEQGMNVARIASLLAGCRTRPCAP